MKKIGLIVAVGVLAAGCASVASETDYGKAALAMMKSDFKSKGPATVEGIINQDEAQKLCSEYPADMPKQLSEKIEAEQLKQVKYPADGKYLGDWKEGEKIAQSGRGMQFSDKIGSPNGGNCYACHQMSKQEISFGNIGPSLYQYGKIRGQSEEMLRYTWAKIFNAQAFAACSNMPRFGHKGILDEQQIKHVMALLLDPESHVNK